MVNGDVTSEFELNALEKQDISCGYHGVTSECELNSLEIHDISCG